MKYLFYTRFGESLPLAFHLKRKGADVAVWILSKNCRGRWEGLIPKAASYGEKMSKDRTIIFDARGGGLTADRLKRQGFETWGSHEAWDKLANEVLQDNVQENYIPCEIQGYFHHGGLKGATLLFDYHRELTGDLGAKVDSAGCVVYPLRAGDTILDVFKGLIAPAQMEVWNGVLGIQARVTEKMLSPVGYRAGMHFSGIYALSEICDIHSLFTADEMVMQGVGCAVNINAQKWADRRIYFPADSWGHVWMYDVALDPVTKGAQGLGNTKRVAAVTGGGATLEDARKAMYGHCQKYDMADKGFRTDIGDEVDTIYKQLQTWGWINDTGNGREIDTGRREDRGDRQEAGSNIVQLQGAR